MFFALPGRHFEEQNGGRKESIEKTTRMINAEERSIESVVKTNRTKERRRNPDWRGLNSSGLDRCTQAVCKQNETMPTVSIDPFLLGPRRSHTAPTLKHTNKRKMRRVVVKSMCRGEGKGRTGRHQESPSL